MAFKKITDSDLKGKGNIGRPDTPGVSTAEMQRILDELPREVIIPALNAIVDELNGVSAAGSFGAQVPTTLPDETAATIQGILNALAAQSSEHIKNKENPHEVQAEQVKATVPQGLPQDTDAQVQAILQALFLYARDHKQSKNNPHEVTAAQVGAYTKKEANNAIRDAVSDAVAGNIPTMTEEEIAEVLDAI